MVRREDHDGLSTLYTQPVQTNGEPLDPFQELPWCQVLLGIVGVDPDRHVRWLSVRWKDVI